LLVSDLVAALMLLTRLPVRRLARSGERPDLGRCIWAFPIVGAAVNGASGLVYWLARTAHMPPLLAAGWTLAATLIITGAFHEDGLADTVDGFGGGATPARKLEIMRDSRIGSYGAAALFLSLIVRTAAIAALGLPRVVLTAMIVAGALGRSAMIVPLLFLRPARGDGMGASVGEPRLINAGVGLGFAVITSFLFLPPLPGAGVVVLGFGSSWVLTIIAGRQVGGHTGDVLGAAEVVVECGVLTLLASAFDSG
jgi:adenosylcobinamide-GDP ribazoletransferase